MMGERQSKYGSGKEGIIRVGPWGGQAGARWDDGVYTGVRQVIIVHGAAIDSIQFEFDKKGTSVWSDKHGGTAGINTNKVKFEYPEEYLVSISGHYGGLVQFGTPIVRSIVLETNITKYGPFGIQQGTHFSVPLGGAKVVGFHGRCSWYLDSIGVHLIPPFHQNPFNYLIHNIPQAQGFPSKPRGSPIHDYNAVETRTKEGISWQHKDTGSATGSNVKLKQGGPWGGGGGAVFDDGVYTGVREVHLTRSSKGLVSILVCYDLNGNSVWGKKSGGTGGIRLDRICFDYPSQVLTHITGYYGSTISRVPAIVRSITFHTNTRKYGPFGDEQGTFFTSDSNHGKIVGFHGRRGNYVDSIGVHFTQGTTASSPQLIQRSTFDNSIILIKEISLRQEPIILPVVKQGSYGGTTWRSGAWGGERGKAWDDGVFNGVKTIFLTRGEAIYCIQTEYQDNGGQFVWSPRHGSGSEGNSQMIKFDYPHEFLTAVSGYHSSLTGDEKSQVIHSLTFYTNTGKYGPYGKEMGTFFTSPESKQQKIVGFHGRSGCYLNALGVHIQQQQQQSSVSHRDSQPSMAGHLSRPTYFQPLDF
ncbi:Jacalin-related lectin 3 [Linum grandiflorum]